MLKLNAPAEIHWRRSNMNKRDPFLMKYVEVLKDCRNLNAADEMNCPMPRSVEKVPVRNEKRCSSSQSTSYTRLNMCTTHGLLEDPRTQDTTALRTAGSITHYFRIGSVQWRCHTPFLIANRHLFSSDRQIALVSSAGIPLRQRSPHIDIVHLYKARGIENRHSAPR